jgi:hypothetical protein
MNKHQILLARDLLISSPRKLALNAVFLGLIWYSALAGSAGH